MIILIENFDNFVPPKKVYLYLFFTVREKNFFTVCDHVMLMPACSATETRQNLENSV